MTARPGRRLGLALLAMALSSVAAASARPVWIDRPSSDPRFPTDRYVTASAAVSLTGVTAAATGAQLDAAVRAAVAVQLAGRIASRLTDDEKEVLDNDRRTSARSIIQRVQQTVEDFDVAGIEIVDRWREGDTAYGFGVLEKGKAVRLAGPKLADLVRTASEHLAHGGEMAAADPGGALVEYLRAVRDGEKAWGGRSVLRVLGGDAADIPPPTAATQRLTALAGKIALSIESGADQRVTDGKPLPRPIVVAARVGRTAVGTLPLAIQMGGARLQSRVSTGPDGRAQVRVDDVGRFDGREKPVNVTVDWPALVSTASGAASASKTWLGPFPAIAASTTAQRKCRETLRVLVRISELIMMSQAGDDPRPVPEPPVASAIAKALESAGLKPMDVRDLEARLVDPTNAGDAEVRGKAAELADVLVMGTATSRESGKYGQTTVWHRARADLRVLDLGTGRVIAVIAEEAKAKRPGDPAWAGRSALEALSEKVAPAIPPPLLKELGP